MGQVTISIGAQWGDEGKGKWIDALSEGIDLNVRYQGGNNAGHTLYVQGSKIVLHQLPSGVFQPDVICALAAGVVINPSALLDEMSEASQYTTLSPQNLWISGRAHMITPWHIYLDGAQESKAKTPIGTTKRGIGPTYADKAARHGIRCGTWSDPNRYQAWLTKMAEMNAEFATHRKEHQAEWQKFEEARAGIAPYVCDAEDLIRKAIRDGKNVLLEGAQGALLDLDHGTYPYVTSSGTSAGGACHCIGLPPKSVSRVIGIAKAYLTRVGTGPFPTELFDDVGATLAKKGNEFGATTGRPRRCGWLDGVALKYVVEMNGLDAIALNKIDILTGQPEIKLAVGYEHPELGRLDSVPYETSVLEECKPIYETFPGWTETIPTSGKISDLPQNALAFVEAVEKFIGIPVTMVGTGPEREDGLFR